MTLPFSETDLDALRSAVEHAEEGSPGEIVVVVVPKSESYEAVLWRGGVLGLVLSMLLWAGLVVLWNDWGAGRLLSPLFGAGLCGILTVAGAIAARRHGYFFRLLAGKTLLERTVRERARRTFLDHGVSETAERTGVLLFASALERRIEIVADKGINAVIPNDRWQEVVDVILEGLARGETVKALSDGIAACGDILRGSGIAGATRDVNELSDDIRLETD